MARKKQRKRKKLKSPVTLFAVIEEMTHEALRYIAYKERKSIAKIVREALVLYIKKRTSKKRRNIRKISKRNL